MKIVMVSDTHGKHPALPAGDVLVHCGDLTHFGSFAELRAEVEWLKSLVFRYVILIGGNHDIALGNPNSRWATCVANDSVCSIRTAKMARQHERSIRVRLFQPATPEYTYPQR